MSSRGGALPFVKVIFDLEEPLSVEQLDADADDAEARLREHILNKCGYDSYEAYQFLRKLFSLSDTNGSGTIDAEEFRRVVVGLNVHKKQEVLRHLFDRYDRNDDGALQYKEFCEAVIGNPFDQGGASLPLGFANPNGTSTSASHGKGSSIPAAGLRSAEISIRAQIGVSTATSNTLTLTSNTFNASGSVVRVTDTMPPIKRPGVRTAILKLRERLSGRGHSAVSDFRQQLLKCGNKVGTEDFIALLKAEYDLDVESTAALAKAFARDTTGQIDAAEFIVVLRGKLSARREQLVRLAFRQILLLASNGADSHPAACVRFSELLRLFDPDAQPDVQAGRRTAEDAVRAFVASWGAETVTDVQPVTERHLLDYYKDLSPIIASDDEFENLLRSSWRKPK